MDTAALAQTTQSAVHPHRKENAAHGRQCQIVDVDDIQHGRITEVEDMCGAIARLAKQVGTQAPCNEAICKLIAKHTKGHRYTGQELRLTLKI